MAVAQQLRERGHEVVFAGYRSQGDYFAARDLPFRVLAASDDAARAATGPDVFNFLEAGIMCCAPQLGEVPGLAASEGAEVLVVDCMMFAALTAAEVAGIPAAVLVHTTPGALAGAGRGFEDRLLPSLCDLRRVAGLGPVERMWDAWNTGPVLITSIPELDPLAGEAPEEFHYLGPVFERTPASGWEPPWGDDARPLVLVSFSSGSAWQGQRSRLERTLAGLAGLGCRVLATVSEADVTGLGLPEGAVLVRHVPHLEVLPQVSAVVTHAGHGTVVAALAHGVPLVCLPRPEMPPDQVPLAEQVQAHGAGLVLDGETATPVEIAAATRRVLGDASYRRAARALADRMRSYPGASGAASIIESLATL
ncbi:MAG: glycosyltransferase [Acidimicrobiales bacterium]